METKCEKLTDIIKENLIAYIWSGVGEENDAADNLEAIFRTCAAIDDKIEELSADRKSYHTRALKAEMKVKELETKLKELT